MAKADHHLSTLFRSLGPDEAGFQNAAKAAISQVEERWPLLKALAPRPAEATPTLTAEERSRWKVAAAPSVGTARPTLSQPGLSDKMAQGLSKLSGMNAAGAKTAPNPWATAPAAPGTAPSLFAQSTPSLPAKLAPAPAVVPPTAQAPLATPRPTRNSQSTVMGKALAPAAPAVQTKQLARTLFSKEKTNVEAPAPQAMPTQSGATDSSLKGIFNRLQRRIPASAPTTQGRFSFLGRKNKS